MDKLSRLGNTIKEYGPVAIAFSGGVDSTLLLKIAIQNLPGQVYALTAISDFLPESEIKAARQTARSLGAPVLEVPVDLLASEDITANRPNRCYICKCTIYKLFFKVMAERGLTALMDGTNLDDLSENRPGHQAIRELAVHTPLAAVGFTKVEIRQMSRALGLPNWSRPSASCLATRIPHGTRIVAEKLRMVAAAETFLNGLGFSGCRVRLHGDTAHLELAAGDMDRLFLSQLRKDILFKLQEIGIRRVLVDLVERELR